MGGLNRLILEGFKSIRTMDLHLSPLTVLIGANGAGKSNLLSFFRMLNAVSAGNLQRFVGEQGRANALLHYGRKRTPQMSATMEFDTTNGKNTYKLSLIGVAPDDLMFADEEVSFTPATTGSTPKPSHLGGGHRESRLPDAVNAGNITARTVKWTVDRWRFYHFHDTSPAAPIKQTCSIKDNRLLRTDGANLSAFLYMLKTAYHDHYERIRDTIRLAAPFFDDFILEPDEANPNSIYMEWRETGSDTPLFAHQLSDGTIRFIALTTLLLQPDLKNRPLLVLIDEPELGLHPYAITLLASMLQTASKRFQIIVSTQSVTLLDQLEETESVVVVDRENGQSVFRRLNESTLETWLEEYSLGELWTKNVLGGRPSP